MTKLLLANGSFYEDHFVTPLTYLLAYDVLNDLAGDVIGTDRYTLDVEHERLNRIDWHDLAQQHPIEPTSSSDDIVIGD